MMPKTKVAKNEILQVVMDAVITDTFHPILQRLAPDMHAFRVNKEGKAYLLEIKKDDTINSKLITFKLKALNDKLEANDVKELLEHAVWIYKYTD